MAELARLQHWMLSRIVTDALPDEGEQIASARDAVRARGPLAPEERVRIYARGYVLRLLEAMRADFPLLHAFVGAQVFDLFATAYLAQHESRSPSLYDLGAGFADFLESTRPAEGAGRGTLEAIPASLARLERAMAESSRAPGPETAHVLNPLVPALLPMTPGQRLRLPQSVRLLRLDFDFAPLMDAVERAEKPPIPVARDVAVAVARHFYRVHMHVISPICSAWLAALGHDGADMADATAAARKSTSTGPQTVFAEVTAFLPFAAANGLIVAAA